MKVGVLGATGGTGIALVEQLLAAGHEVAVVARRPEAVPAADRVRVTAGTASDVEALSTGLQGCELVVNVVGVSGLREARRGTTVYSDSARALLAAAPQAGYGRVVAVTSGGVVPQPSDGWFYVHVLKRFFLEPTYRDMRVAEELLRGQSAVEWTLVRPGYLTGDAQRTDYRVSVDTPLVKDGSLTRWSLAHALVHRALDPATAGHALFVAT